MASRRLRRLLLSALLFRATRAKEQAILSSSAVGRQAVGPPLCRSLPYRLVFFSAFRLFPGSIETDLFLPFFFFEKYCNVPYIELSGSLVRKPSCFFFLVSPTEIDVDSLSFSPFLFLRDVTTIMVLGHHGSILYSSPRWPSSFEHLPFLSSFVGLAKTVHPIVLLSCAWQIKNVLARLFFLDRFEGQDGVIHANSLPLPSL